MRAYINKLREKPDHHRKRFALLVSGSVTIVIFAIWALVRLSGTPQVAKSTTGPVDLAATVQSNSFGEIVDGIKSSVHSIANVISNGK